MPTGTLKPHYGYKHWTLEDVPRCFYVGKGQGKRAWDKRRSLKWRHVSDKHGLRVEVCEQFEIHGEALHWEINTIASMETYHFDNPNGIGCNFTRGGDGVVGLIHTLATREKCRQVRLGQHTPDEVCEKIRQAKLGQRPSDETRRKISESHMGLPSPMKGRHHTPESNEKNRQTNRIKQAGEKNGMFGRKHSPEAIEKMREAKRRRVNA